VAERSDRRLIGCAALTAALVLAVPAAADANTRHQGDHRHDVTKTTFAHSSGKTWRVPAVRADDLTSVRATYAHRRLTATVRMVARDRWADETYMVEVDSRTTSLIAFVATSPIDPKGSVFTLRTEGGTTAVATAGRLAHLARKAEASKAHACGRITHHVAAHAVRVSFPARCLHFAAKVRVTASAQRDFAHSWFEDDIRAVTVRRG
jgi:hypothetical protein